MTGVQTCALPILDKDLTRQINKLYAEEVELKNRRQALEAKKSALNDERYLCCRNKRDASRRYENARAEKREAEEKCEEAKNWWWVPGYGLLLSARELGENNEKKVRDARREMERYDREMSGADRNIKSANTAISQVGVFFNDIIFYPITDCLLKRLQRIQFAAASFVFGRYVNNIDSVLKLGWLPMKERIEWHVLKAAHKAIYSHDWPRNLQLEQVRHARNLRSSSTINLVIPHASDTFQYSAAALFNSLPSNVKCCDNFKSFSKQTLCILRERCQNRAE